MALTIIGALDNLQRGVELPETGIGVRRFTVRTFPAVSEDHTDNLGEVDGRVVSTVPSAEVTVEGETTGATGVMAHTFLTNSTLANDIATFGANAGLLLLQEVTETQEAGGWRTVSLRYRKDPTLTVV
jgi:hypothetical protein